MSLRIHELAKRHNMESKDMLALLKERGYVSADTKSVSSTVSKIYIEEIEKEFAAKLAAQKAAEAKVEVAPASVAPEGDAPRVKLPAGVFVKSAQDVAREKEEQARAARPAVVMPAPVAPRPHLPAKGRAVIAPPQALRPVGPPAVSTPRALAVEVAAPKPAPAAPTLPPAVKAAPRPSSPPSTKPLSTTPVPLPHPPTLPPPVLAGKAAPLPPAAPDSPAATATQNGDAKIIHLKPPIIVRDFAIALGLKPFRLISELMEMSIFASMNQSVEEGVAVQLAEKHGFLLEIKHRGEAQPATVAAAAAKMDEKTKDEKAKEEDLKNLRPRPPVVCILGHVDHGKTSILDSIRKAEVAAGESGGITQHIGAYQIEHNGRKVTFLDTPGHAAFTKMRARGANVTDIAVLVVAADDGFMPQTEEALQHVQNAKVALIVAVNKMDVKGANLDRVKGQMQERGIASEDWGGDTICVPVSAVKGQGIADLLDMILLQSDVLELKANPKAAASGIVIESQIDVGRGPLATVIVGRGTLRVGDTLVCGPHWCRVRAMFDDQGKNLKEAPPSTPVRVIGWSGTPDSGMMFQSVKNAREAERQAEAEQERLKKEVVAAAAQPKDTSLDALFANIAATQQKVLRVVVKCDVYGSVEAIRNVLESIKSTKVSLEMVGTEVGLISKNDVLLASAAKAIIVGFNTKQENGVVALAKHHGVQIYNYDIIYELGDRVKEMMADLLEPDLKESKLGVAEVRQVFPVSKGFVAGCLVTEGKVNRNASARVRRGKEILFEGKVGTLRRFKDDANEVRAGLECGVRLDGFDGYEPGDRIECYEIQKVRASL
ncbi:MAG: translation initiation factor IF-2 [Opitutaceae bacterium]|nr:translation initiation factor IF-2 [Opitutaceae bacterium]